MTDKPQTPDLTITPRKAVGQRSNYKLVKVLEQDGNCYEQNLLKGATATCNRFELWGVLKR